MNDEQKDFRFTPQPINYSIGTRGSRAYATVTYTNTRAQQMKPIIRIRVGDNAEISAIFPAKGEQLTVRKNDNPAAYEKAMKAKQAEDWELLYSSMRPIKAAVTGGKITGVSLVNGQVMFAGKPVENAVAQRIIEFSQVGEDFNPLCLFLEKLMQNPSFRAVKELYTFLENKNLPITDDGDFVAYKSVTDDYYSITAGRATLLSGSDLNGRILNKPGEVVKIPRNEVNDDKDTHCSYGLHAGSLEYARDHFHGSKAGYRMVLVKINPADVVSVPVDFQCQKLRTCAYTVISDFQSALEGPVYTGEIVKKSEPVTPPAVKTEGRGIAFPTKSSWIKSVDWNDEVLTINKHGGGTIVYDGVPVDIIVEWSRQAGLGNSTGEYYNNHIKGQYDHRKA